MGCQCVDLDKYIEDTAGMSIPEIFAKIFPTVDFPQPIKPHKNIGLIFTILIIMYFT